MSTRRVPLFFIASNSSLGVNWLQPVLTRIMRHRVNELSNFVQGVVNLFRPDPVITLSFWFSWQMGLWLVFYHSLRASLVRVSCHLLGVSPMEQNPFLLIGLFFNQPRVVLLFQRPPGSAQRVKFLIMPLSNLSRPSPKLKTCCGFLSHYAYKSSDIKWLYPSEKGNLLFLSRLQEYTINCSKITNRSSLD